MTAIGWVFDAILATALAGAAWRALSSDALFTAIASFVAFGLLMTLAWVRLSAPDIALAEAGIGAGFTGALFLAALARLRRVTGEDGGGADRRTSGGDDGAGGDRHAGT